MKVGMLARAEHRGLGHMCLEWYRHMQPDRTLLVLPDAVRHAHLTSHLDWYPDATRVRFNGQLDEPTCRAWLDGLDVVYTAETFYDWRFCRWAKEQGVATLCHVMPEWMRPEWAAEPSAWWAPTSWRLDLLPENTRLVPVPIALDRFDPRPRTDDGTFRWLHIAGAETHGDRNGTNVLLDATRALTEGQTVTVRTQSDVYQPRAKNTTIDLQAPEQYWEMYDGFDGLVMPRRYAGLCLPVMEAFGAGLPVVMSDMAPQNTDWPVQTALTMPSQPIRMMGGYIPTGNVDPTALAATMNGWANDPTTVRAWREKSQQFAVENSWHASAPQVREELERAADLVSA